MTHAEREVNRKLRILNHAEESGNIVKTCRYFGIPRSLQLNLIVFQTDTSVNILGIRSTSKDRMVSRNTL